MNPIRRETFIRNPQQRSTSIQSVSDNLMISTGSQLPANKLKQKNIARRRNNPLFNSSGKLRRRAASHTNFVGRNQRNEPVSKQNVLKKQVFGQQNRVRNAAQHVRRAMDPKNIPIARKVSIKSSVTSSGIQSQIRPSVSSGDRSILQIPRNKSTLNKLKLKGYTNLKHKTENQKFRDIHDSIAPDLLDQDSYKLITNFNKICSAYSETKFLDVEFQPVQRSLIPNVNDLKEQAFKQNSYFNWFQLKFAHLFPLKKNNRSK